MIWTPTDNTIVKPYVPPTWPQCPVMLVGEAPGREEVASGVPFVGESGRMLAKEFNANNINWERDVYRTNVVPVNPGKFPDGRKGAMLIDAWADRLDEELRTIKPKVIALCGGVALQRVTSFTNITDWMGSVLRNDDIPHYLTFFATKTGGLCVGRNAILPPDVVIVPMIHPSAIMHTKGRNDMPLLKRQVQKVARAVRDELRTYPFELVCNPDVRVLRREAAKATQVTFDTEFNPEKEELYLVGLTFDGYRVFSLGWDYRYFAFLYELFTSKLLKVAHNIIADARILKANKIPLAPPIYCSMIGQYVLHPPNEVGLSPSSRYNLDDVMHRKWMDKTDPTYNAYDVIYCHFTAEAHKDDMKRRPVEMAGVMESKQRLIMKVGEMEEAGLLVDRLVQEKLLATAQRSIDRRLKGVRGRVRPMWERKQAKVRVTYIAAEEAYKEMRTRYAGVCKKHPKYYPTAKNPSCLVCGEIKERDGKAFALEYEVKKKRRDDLRKLALKEFNFNSHVDLAWLLYSAEALNLPIRKDSKTKKVTTNADAIERLSQLKSVRGKLRAFKVVQAIKKMQQQSGAIAKFIDVPVDKDGYAHPRYKVHGTVTARLESGKDVDGEEDKVNNDGAYNGLNIPVKFRQMYAAPPGKAIVALDWKNQEGRLMAYFSQDAQYINAFKEEDGGGVDVHSRTAQIIYGVDPKEAKERLTKFGSGMYDMRHCAKVANHACSYSPTPIFTLMKNFQLQLSDARRIVDVMFDARPTLARYKQDLVKEVLGEWEPVRLGENRWAARCVKPGRRWDATPFGWMIKYWGMGEVREDAITAEKLALPTQAGEAIAFRQQATGAGMWDRCYDEITDKYQVYTGSYDSFYVLTNDDKSDILDAAAFCKGVMEKEWPELDGWKFPADVAWGYNLGKYKRGRNDYGLRGI